MADDSVPEESGTKTDFSLDSTNDALTEESGTKTDFNLTEQPSVVGSFDAALKDLDKSVSSNFDTVIEREDLSISATFDTVVKGEQSVTASVDVAIKDEDVAATGAFDTVIKEFDISEGGTFDAAIQQTDLSESATVDAVIKKQNEATGAFDTVMKQEDASTAGSFDTVIKSLDKASGATFDTAIQETDLQTTATVDAAVADRNTASAAVDTYIAYGKPGNFTAVIDGVSYTGVTNVEVETHLNELHTFTFDAYIEDDQDRQLIQEGQQLLLFDGRKLIFQGELEDVNYDSTFKAECEGSGLKLKLLKNKTPRKEYINQPADDIIRDLLGGSSEFSLGTVENAPVITIRVDHDNELRAAAGVANAVGYDLFAYTKENENFDNIYVDFVEHKGSKSSVATLNIAEELQIVDRGKDNSVVANDITILGRGDGINQKEARLFAATTHRTVTTQRIQASDTTTLDVNDATQIGSTGDEVYVRVGEEVVHANIQDSTTLDILARGQDDYKNDSTVDGQHYEDIQVFLKENVTQSIGPFEPTRDKAEDGSSIERFGNVEERSTDKTLIDRATVEKVCDNELKNRREPVFRVEVDLTDPRELEDLGISVGDNVTIEDLTAPDVSNEFRVVGIDYKRASADEATTLHCANRPIRLVERLSEIERDRDTLNAHMQGATNFNGESFEDNCDNAHPLSNKIFVPDDVVEINKFELTFTREAFRGYVQNSAHSHEVTHPSHSHDIDKIPDHTHDINTTTPAAAGDADQAISDFQLIPYSDNDQETLTAEFVDGEGGYLLVFWNLANSGNNSNPFEGTREIRDATTGETIVQDSSSILYYVGDNNVLMGIYTGDGTTDLESDDIEFIWDGAGGSGSDDMVWNYGVITVGEHEHNISDTSNTQNTPSTTETSKTALGTTDTTTDAGEPSYGLFEPVGEASVDVEVQVDGNTVTTINDVSVNEEVSQPIDLKNDLSDPVTGEYHDISLIPKGVSYSDGFEDESDGAYPSGWTDTQDVQGEADTAYAANGGVSFLHGNGSSYSDGPQAYHDLSTTGEVDEFSFWYRETSNSTGHGMSLEDSNGDRLFFVGTDNPELQVFSGNGFEYSGNGGPTPPGTAYGVWRQIVVKVDNKNDEFTVDRHTPETGDTNTYGPFPLASTNQAVRVNVENYNNASLSGSTSGLKGWVDDVDVNGRSRCRLSADIVQKVFIESKL